MKLRAPKPNLGFPWIKEVVHNQKTSLGYWYCSITRSSCKEDTNDITITNFREHQILSMRRNVRFSVLDMLELCIERGAGHLKPLLKIQLVTLRLTWIKFKIFLSQFGILGFNVLFKWTFSLQTKNNIKLRQ